MYRDSYPLARTQAAGITLLPVAAGRTVVEEVGVYIDESRYASSSSTRSSSATSSGFNGPSILGSLPVITSSAECEVVLFRDLVLDDAILIIYVVETIHGLLSV